MSKTKKSTAKKVDTKPTDEAEQTVVNEESTETTTASVEPVESQEDASVPPDSDDESDDANEPSTDTVPEEPEEPSTDPEPEEPASKKFEPAMMEKESPVKRSKVSSEVYQMAAETLTHITKQLDIPATPDYNNPKIPKLYISLFREVVRCIKVEKTSDMTALCNFVLDLIAEYPRVYGINRLFAPLRYMELSDRELRFYEELFNVLIMVNTDGKMDRRLLETRFNGLLDPSVSERFTGWVLARQA